MITCCHDHGYCIFNRLAGDDVGRQQVVPDRVDQHAHGVVFIRREHLDLGVELALELGVEGGKARHLVARQAAGGGIQAFGGVARQLDLVLDRMAARIGLSATGRFYRALLMLADDEGTIRPAPVVAAMALSVHTTRETGSRALAALLRRGIAERLPDGLRIVSRRMLEDLVV